MTTEVNVPSSDHIARYCKPTTLTENGAPTGASFCLRPEETSLSVKWLEYLDNIDRGNALEQLRRVYAQKFKRISAEAKVAVLNAGEVITHVYNECDRLLSILHEPTDNDPSH